MLRSEVRKLTTVWMPAGLIVAAIVVAAVGAFSTTSSMSVDALDGSLRDQEFFLLASINLGIFAALLGVRTITDEFAHGTILWTLLIDNRRSRQMAAKAGATASAAALMGAAGAAAAAMVATTVASRKGGALTFDAADAAAIAGLVATSAGWAVIGFGVGALLRRPVAAVVSVVVWMLVIENLGATFLGDAGRFLPGQAAHAFAGVGATTGLLSVGTGAIVTLAYAGSALVAAILSMQRRSVEVGA